MYIIYKIILINFIYKDKFEINEVDEYGSENFENAVSEGSKRLENLKQILYLAPTIIISIFYIYINYITLFIPKKYNFLKMIKINKFTKSITNIILNIIGVIFGIISILFFKEIFPLKNKLIIHGLWHTLSSISLFFIILSHNL